MINKLSMILIAMPLSVMAETQIEKEDYQEKLVLEERFLYEKMSDENPFSLTTHKMNYILPYTYADRINTEAYSHIDDKGMVDEFKNEEVKFQMSVKFPLMKEVFHDEDMIYFGFTMKSYWQLYAKGASRPFRNTDYNPELFYVTNLVKKEDYSSFLMVGIEHESNGQIQHLSRSWNRAYLQVVAEQDNYALSLKTWYRLPEDKKEYLLDPEGDDNPDIGDYYGNFELTGVYRYNDIQYSAKGRYNFAEDKGLIELGATFPIYGRLKGYVQFVNGYGESLLDYNHLQRRIGVGIAFSDML